MVTIKFLRDEKMLRQTQQLTTSLVARRATYVVEGRFFGHFFWKVEGTVRIHVNSHVAHVWLLYMVINVQDRGETNIKKLEKFGNF